MVTLKRAGLPVDYEPWRMFMAQVDDDIEEMSSLLGESLAECREWLENHSDEPEDLVIGQVVRLPELTPQLVNRLRQPITGVVSIRSFLRQPA